MSKETISPDQDKTALPKGMIIAGAWSWRIIAIFIAIAVFIYVASLISEVIIPFAVAILIGALLVPIVNKLHAKGWPRGLAVATSLVGTVVVIAGLLALISTQIHHALPDLQARGATIYSSLKTFLSSTLGFNQQDIDNGLKSIEQYAQEHSSVLTSGLASAGTTAGHVVVGLVLALFSLIFILIDGKNIWSFFVRLFPTKARPAIQGSGEVSWVALKSFVRSQVLVAVFDGAFIGVVAFVLGLPLAIPIGILVFLGAFIPVVGAVLTGAVAILIALVFNGPIIALLMLVGVILVQEIESHLLQPFLIGKSVNIHPLAIVLSVAIGSIIGGIPGALFAVPVVAVLTKSVSYIAHRRWEKQPPVKSA